jgi:hypothetical protein
MNDHCITEYPTLRLAQFWPFIKAGKGFIWSSYCNKVVAAYYEVDPLIAAQERPDYHSNFYLQERMHRIIGAGLFIPGKKLVFSETNYCEIKTLSEFLFLLKDYQRFDDLFYRNYA